MSFSGTVKEELLKHVPAARHCQIAELAAILHFCGHYEGLDQETAQDIPAGSAWPNGKNVFVQNAEKTDKNTVKLFVQAENEAVVRKCFTLLRKTFNINTSVNETFSKKTAGRPASCSILLEKPEEAAQVLQAAKFMDKDGRLTDLRDPVSSLIIKNACCQRAFLRGAFLAAGSMSDPEKSYHLEIVCTNAAQAEQICSILLLFQVEARIVQRKKYQIVYMKDGAGISDFLNIVEAHVSLMTFENYRIVKEMRNSVNRRVNCETANISKTVSASTRQVDDILFLKQKYGLANLPENLREMAEVRLENPDAPLRELGEYLNPPVGKSGVNHRLRKLSELADRLREGPKEQ
ncbi:MAG TPA: DNA-binding protein WhiA [Candidatus Eisenbergiella merdavium]|uniref:Probable cell division protein WhiA n=1 Tax=Candidatus Eisenbergiella merdavium TaxID=2838551 RepID=A0A9D2NEU4_9FIRM|nr:DNA-binding protein WhiA [Candidatus Eisenbergiella merdavium]